MLVIMLASSTVATVFASDGKQAQDNARLSEAQQLLNNRKAAFIENKGQIVDSDGRERPDIRFVADMGPMTVYFMNDGISYVLNDRRNISAHDKTSHESQTSAPHEVNVCRVDMKFIDNNSSAAIYAEDRKPEAINYYRQTGYAQGIQTAGYNRLIYKDIYDHTDIVFSMGKDGLKYDFIVYPGGDPSKVRWAYEGARNVGVSRDGRLEIATPLGVIREDIPLTFQEGGEGSNQRVDKQCGFVVKDNIASFTIQGYDPAKKLVIDPYIKWAMFYGSSVPGGLPPISNEDHFTSVAVDNQDNVVAVGYTYNTVFPVVSALQPASGGFIDAVIVKYNAAGNILWSTYYGGNAEDRAMGVAIDAANQIVVTGYTYGGTFPTLAALHPVPLGGADAFMIHLPPAGLPLNWASMYGGAGDDFGMDVAITPGQVPIMTGYTNSPSATFDLLWPVQPLLNQMVGPTTNYDAFVIAGFAGVLSFGTYMGGDANDYGMGIIADAVNDIAITGYTQGPGPALINYPIVAAPGAPGAFQPVYGGGTYDAFVSRITVPLFGAPAVVVWSTYVGGMDEDRGQDIAMVVPGSVLGIVGYTKSPAMPMPMQTAKNNPGTPNADALVAWMDYAPGYAIRGTYWGGPFDDLGNDIAIARDGSNRIAITGTTEGMSPLPLDNSPFQQNFAGGICDAFIAYFESLMLDVRWDTYYGSSSADSGAGIAFDSKNRTVIVGSTFAPGSANLPVRTNPPYNVPQGGWDGFIAMFDHRNIFPVFVGGTSSDKANDVAVDSENSVIITGYTKSNTTSSPPFPATIGAATLSGTQDAFIAKYSRNGNMLWITYYGGSGVESGEGIAVDNADNIYIAGYTTSTGGIAMGGGQFLTYGGGTSDGFIAKFDGNGTQLWGTYVGGSAADTLMDIVIENYASVTRVVAVGYSNSNNRIGTAGTQQPTRSAGLDAICVKYNTSGGRVWGTYSGGANDDYAFGVATIDNKAVMVGCTAGGYPTYGATSFTGASNDAFVTFYYGAGTSPWSLMYGGQYRDTAAAAIVAGWDKIYVAGTTLNQATNNFPISPGASVSASSNSLDLFWLRLDTTGVRVLATVYVEPAGHESARSLARRGNNALLAGWTNSSTFTALSGLPSYLNAAAGADNAFVLGTDPNLNIVSGTLFGRGSEKGEGIAVDSHGDVLLCGETASSDFLSLPDVDNYWAQRGTNSGSQDAFIAKFTNDEAALAKQSTVAEQTRNVSPAPAIATISFQAYPNPNDGLLNISGRINNDGPVVLLISDIRGAQVYSSTEFVRAGRLDKQVDITSLPSGTYVLRVQSGGQESSVTIVRK